MEVAVERDGARLSILGETGSNEKETIHLRTDFLMPLMQHYDRLRTN